MNDDANEILIAELRARAAFGEAKYGTPLRTFDGRNTLHDIREELLDGAVYVTKEMAEREAIADRLLGLAEVLDAHNERHWAAQARNDSALLRADVPRIGGAS